MLYNQNYLVIQIDIVWNWRISKDQKLFWKQV